MSLAKLKWYAARLAVMSPPEVAHRVREAALKRGWRGNTGGWDNFGAIGTGDLCAPAGLRARLAASAPLAGDALARLDAGRLCGLGRVVDDIVGDDVWFIDPVSGTPWPKDAYCFDVDVRSTGKDRGDVKFVWEINRLQFLHPLAAEIAANPAAARIDQAFAYLTRWAAANPPYRGVNWFSGIELAMRMVTLTLLISAIPAEALSAERRMFLRRLIAAHGFWLHRYPSKYSSANNHLLAEGLGLLLAGVLVPDLPHAAEWEAEGRSILEKEAALQIFADGVGGEQSPTYQAFTMEMLAFGMLVAREAGKPLASVASERLIAGARFLQALLDDAGGCPKIGDDDEGRVIAAPPDREPRYVASIVAAVAGLCNDAGLAPPARDPHLRDALFSAPDTASAADDGLSVFAEGGYSIARHTVGGQSTVLTFDHGPLGFLALAAHGHADALALWLSVGGRPVLVDAGTYLYHSGGALRNSLRSSPAHNTLTLADVSQSQPSSAFSWSTRADARLSGVRQGEWWSVSGEHEGYRRRFGVTHRRTVSREPTGFAVTDELVGASRALPVKIAYLVAPDCKVRHEGDRLHLTSGDQALLQISIPAGFRVQIVRGEREGGRGLHSPAFGELVVASQIVLSAELPPGPVTTRIILP